MSAAGKDTPRVYEVEIGESGAHVTARSRAQARYLVWLDFSDAWECSFRDFLDIVTSVRLSGKRTRYSYSAERYGVDVGAGDKVTAGGKPGIVAEPPGSNGRASYISVYQDGISKPYHPSEVAP